MKQRLLETAFAHTVDSLQQPLPLGFHHCKQLTDAARRSRLTHSRDGTSLPGYEDRAAWGLAHHMLAGTR